MPYLLAPLAGSLGPLALARGTGIDAALYTSLVAYWRLEEASGTRVDSTGRGNDLTPTGSPGNTTGILGSALSLTANTMWASKTSTSDLAAGDVDMSWAAWVYPTTSTSSLYCLEKGSLSGGGALEFGLRTNSAGGAGSQWTLIAGTLVTGGFFTTVSAGTFTLNTWHYLVGWHDSVNNLIGLSVNGAASVTAAWSGGLGSTSFPLVAGGFSNTANPTGTGSFIGRLDEAAVWRRRLTDAQIASLYNSGAGLALY